jgi:hypothetical protein
MASLFKIPKKQRPLVLGLVGAAAAYFLFFRHKTPAAAAPLAPTSTPVAITVASGAVTYPPGSTTGYIVQLPSDGSSWVTVNGAAPSSPTAAIQFPSGMVPDGTYVWNNMTAGGQSTTTISAAASSS